MSKGREGWRERRYGECSQDQQNFYPPHHVCQFTNYALAEFILFIILWRRLTYQQRKLDGDLRKFFSSGPTTDNNQASAPPPSSLPVASLAAAVAPAAPIVQTTTSKRRQRRCDLLSNSRNRSGLVEDLERSNNEKALSIRQRRSQVGNIGRLEGSSTLCASSEVSSSLTEPNLRRRLAEVRGSRAKTAVEGGDAGSSSVVLWGEKDRFGNSSGRVLEVHSTAERHARRSWLEDTNIRSSNHQQQSDTFSADLEEPECHDSPSPTTNKGAGGSASEIPGVVNCNKSIHWNSSFRMTGRRAHPIQPTDTITSGTLSSVIQEEQQQQGQPNPPHWNTVKNSPSSSMSPQRKERSEAFTEAMIQAATEEASTLVKEADEKAAKAVEAAEVRARDGIARAEQIAIEARNRLEEAEQTIAHQQLRIRSLEQQLSKNREIEEEGNPNDDIATDDGGTGGGENDAVRVNGGKGSSSGTEGSVAQREKLIARLSMSTSERRSLEFVEAKDPALVKSVQGGEIAIEQARGPIQQHIRGDSSDNKGRLSESKPSVSRGGERVNAVHHNQQRKQPHAHHKHIQCDTCGGLNELEPDEDNPGTYYCRQCWLEYEEEEEKEKDELAPNLPHSSTFGSSASVGINADSEVPLLPFATVAVSDRKQRIPSLSRGSSNSETISAISQRLGNTLHTEHAVSRQQSARASTASNKAWVLSDNTHLLNQVAGLMPSEKHALYALIEAKMPSGRIRFVIGTILAVGACNKKGSAGANLGTEVVTATTVDASRKGFVHFDGQRGSMFLELGSMVGYDRSIAETKEETIGGFRGMRLNPSAKSGGKQVNLDGGPVSSALAAAFEDIDVNERNSRSAGGTKAPSMVGKLGKGSSAHRDLEWFLSATCARIDVVLVPQQKGNWYPYWEVSSGRKMAPQFRSSGVGYLRLADDVRTETYSIDFLDTRAATLGLTSFCQTSLISMPLRWGSMEKVSFRLTVAVTT